MTGTLVGTKWEPKREPFYMMKEIQSFLHIQGPFSCGPAWAGGGFQVPTCPPLPPCPVSLAGRFCLHTALFGPLAGEPGRVVVADLAHGPGRRMPGAVPVAGAGHMRTDAEMSAGTASLATLAGRAVMGWRWVWPWAVHGVPFLMGGLFIHQIVNTI